jgi:hypothetical protein
MEKERGLGLERVEMMKEQSGCKRMNGNGHGGVDMLMQESIAGRMDNEMTSPENCDLCFGNDKYLVHLLCLFLIDF